MNKKTKAKLDLEATIKDRVASKDDCSSCKQHFSSPLEREAHQKRYPSHFTDSPVANLQVDALPQMHVHRGKKNVESNESTEKN